MAWYTGPRQQPGLGATAGAWLYFRLLAAGNGERGGVPVWSAAELVLAARAEGRRATVKSVAIALREQLQQRGLVERANASLRVDVAWRLSDQVRPRLRVRPGAGHAPTDVAAQGRELAQQHGVEVAAQVENASASLGLWRAQLADAPAAEAAGDAGGAQPRSRRRVSGAGLWFRLVATENAAREGRREWRGSELARAAAAEDQGREYCIRTPSRWLSKMEAEGLVRRTYNSPAAPFTLTAAGEARARELGVRV